MSEIASEVASPWNLLGFTLHGCLLKHAAKSTATSAEPTEAGIQLQPHLQLSQAIASYICYELHICWKQHAPQLLPGYSPEAYHSKVLKPSRLPKQFFCANCSTSMQHAIWHDCSLDPQNFFSQEPTWPTPINPKWPPAKIWLYFWITHSLIIILSIHHPRNPPKRSSSF